MSEKDELLMKLKAQAYDQIAIKEQAEEQLRIINQQIIQAAGMPDDDSIDPEVGSKK